ncbi:hypothetical protein GBAR_LOCUS11916 [Geodia barretti]|uniref:Uncharacterized protein n=1 Tax=Geodia barretti TaxID=519541 RepID=A0AA35RY75_GEOBA|nr:hypothetical protein GBAR_LOCUS11916 [Geodia barretti]
MWENSCMTVLRGAWLSVTWATPPCFECVMSATVNSMEHRTPKTLMMGLYS